MFCPFTQSTETFTGSWTDENAKQLCCQESMHKISLVSRPYACAHERVWLHKSKSLGSLQNLKASNEIAKWRLLE